MLLPPGIQKSWNDNNVMDQAKLLAYDEIRLHEQSKYDSLLSKARGF